MLKGVVSQLVLLIVGDAQRIGQNEEPVNTDGTKIRWLLIMRCWIGIVQPGNLLGLNHILVFRLSFSL